MKKSQRFVVGCDGNNFVYGKEDPSGNAYNIKTFTAKEVRARAKNKYVCDQLQVFELVPVSFS